MPLPDAHTSAHAQALLADHIRNPTLPAPQGIDPERLAVYTRLVRNNLRSFLERCFSDSSEWLDPQQWQDWQHRFLIEARPESPFFNDIPPQFLAYLHRLPVVEQPPAPILAMMDCETNLLHAETAIQPNTSPEWHADTLLTWSPTARLRHYDYDFISSDFSEIHQQPCHVLTWRNRNDEVYYRLVDNIDLFLLQHFQEHNSSFADLLHHLQALLHGQDIAALLHNMINDWVMAGVLWTAEEQHGSI